MALTESPQDSRLVVCVRAKRATAQGSIKGRATRAREHHTGATR